MTQQSIIVRISADGTVTAETHGVKGPKCLDNIALLEDLLQARTVESRFTPEYSEVDQSRHVEAVMDDELQQY